MQSFDKLKLLIWKNYVIQKRHKWQIVFEIASPVVFASFLILLRCIVSPKAKPPLTYSPFLPTYFDMKGVEFGNDSSLKREGTLAFSPENPLLRNLTKNAISNAAKDNLGFLAMFFDPAMIPTPKGYRNAKELELALKQPNAMKTTLVGIQFEDSMINATEWPDDIVVALRFPAIMRHPLMQHPLKASWRTNLLYPFFMRSGPREPDDKFGGKMPGYSAELFLTVQHALSREIIASKSGSTFDSEIMMQRLPQLAYVDDELLVALEKFISMVIMLCFAYKFVNTVRMVTAEKELQLKETMIIMGMPSWLHWLAWYLKELILLTLSGLLIVILVKIPFHTGGVKYSVLTHTPSTVLFVFLMLYMMASLAFAFMISTFFSKANTAASFMGLAWLTSYAFFMLTQVLYEDISFSLKMVLSLISNTAMGYAFQMIVVTEGNAKGLQWGNFLKPVTYHDTFTPGHCVIMFLVDIFVYMAIALYVEKIRPGKYGVPLPWYFPVTKKYWCPVKNKVAELTDADDLQNVNYQTALSTVVHDEEPQGVPIGADIKNLTKIFKSSKRAVDNLCLRIYKDEITVLLGHNGAGKTTTISMMIGMVPPTSGTAIIEGYNIVTETKQARKSIGICPQHNVLFPDLTVAEHIQFYARLKGVPKSRIKEEVDHFVELLELESKRDSISSVLSGGQKRRLSVGAAMCGSSKVVLLDEPTSGLDPSARRALWDLLQKEKKGRTMILTTHFMDEADILGDRIAIMAGGRLQCIGTSYFLKKHYGVGYKMTLVKEENCDVHKLTEFFNKYVPEVKVNTNIGSELTYIMPNDYVHKFPEMLKDLETNKAAFKISSYGLSVTSLEEVFMKAGAEDIQGESFKAKSLNIHEKISMVRPHGSSLHLSGDFEPVDKVIGFKLLKHHIQAMFIKLFYNCRRNKIIALIQCIIPIINITISVIISRSWSFMSELPPLALSLTSGFKSTETLVSTWNNLTDDSFERKVYLAYKNYFKEAAFKDMTLRDLGTNNLEKFYLKIFSYNAERAQRENLIGATFKTGAITAWFSNYGYHDSAISLATLNNAIIGVLSPNSTLTIINHPLPYSIEHMVRVMASGSTMGFQFAFNIGFCMAFVTAFFVLFVVKERVSGAKLLQNLSGVRPAVMWVCAYVWDWLWLLFVHVIIVGTLAIYQESTLSSPAELGRVFLVLAAFSMAVIPQHYLGSFCFDAAASGFSKMCFVNMFLGCMPFLIVEVLLLPEVGSPYYANICDYVFIPLPIYSLSRSLRDLSITGFKLLACNALCDQFVTIRNCTRQTICKKLKINMCCIENEPYFEWSSPGIGRYLTAMVFVGLVLFTILLLKEYGFFKKIVSRKPVSLPPLQAEEDSDVAAERAAVTSMPTNVAAKQSMVCRDLTKYYKKFLAVNRLTFAVRPGECFGLLGINGAGKTSTFRMMTGDVEISAGDAVVHGHSVRTRLRTVHRLIGYCPQFEALFDNLTARETLRIFSLLRGIPQRVGAVRAKKLADALGFLKHFDKLVNQCSGGTKRKISTAVALLGDSPLVFLDEPTTGMDPASKRLVWNSIGQIIVSGRSVVLTSHSMEECEAMCSRLTVMVNGRLYCLGSLQHLKSKFSQGYTLIVKCKPGPDRDGDIARINQCVAETFKISRLVDTCLGITTYYIDDKDLPWSQLFAIMEEARNTYPIEDYAVSQTSLEQVFLMFSKNSNGSETS